MYKPINYIDGYEGCCGKRKNDREKPNICLYIYTYYILYYCKLKFGVWHGMAYGL